MGRSAVGWDEETAAEKLATVRSAFSDSTDRFALDRATVSYRDERLESVLLTTTGTTVRTSLKRASVESVVVPTNAEKLQRHFGTTTGAAFFDALPTHFDELATAVRQQGEYPVFDGDETNTEIGGDDVEIVFGPRAAAELFHHFTHYLEMDAAYFESSPFAVGDRFGPSSLDVEDCVHAGSWAALGYDVEGKPTTPVTLVSNGTVRNHLHDTVSAIEEGTVPMGFVSPRHRINERPPRIHARHLDVDGETTARESLLDGVDVYVESVETPRIENEATRTKRANSMPPSVLYAKDIAATTPSEFDDEATNQELTFPVRLGYTMDGSEREERITEGSVTVSPAELRSITAIGGTRETATGVCSAGRRLPVRNAVVADGHRPRRSARAEPLEHHLRVDYPPVAFDRSGYSITITLTP